MPRIAVLGAGLMGVSAALRLARDGHDVVCYDRAPVPMSGASRWNEGKIHLGFLYAGDVSLRSAERLLPGGLAFRPLLERMIEAPLDRVTQDPDIFLVHRDSVASVEATRAYFQTLVERVRATPGARDYLVDVSDAGVHELTHGELSHMGTGEAVVAGFRVPEHSVDTRWVADRVVDAFAAQRGITPRLSCQVHAVRDDPRRPDRYAVQTADGIDDGYDAVVNALWEDRLRVDASIGLLPGAACTHRYRVSLFVDTHSPVDLPSFVLCTGPFGDVKRYAPQSFYLSWYPEGLLAIGHDVAPPPVPRLDAADMAAREERMVAALAAHVPAVRAVQAAAARVTLGGGWVFAIGDGLLSDPAATLHRRDRIGIRCQRRYFSVDTGKYSIAPWLAEQLAEAVRDSLA